MFVRVYDKAHKRYFKSVVYALLGTGYYEQAVVFDSENNRFVLTEYFDKDSDDLQPQYERINCADMENWVTRENAFLLKLKKYCRERGFDASGVCSFRGYEDVYQNFSFLLALLRDGTQDASVAGVLLRKNPDEGDWTYIRTQEDADEFMNLFACFHDAELKKIDYTEEYGCSKLTARFSNVGWYGIADLCFEGVFVLNLRPPTENHSGNLYFATLLVRDESIFWADGEVREEDFAEDTNGHIHYNGSYIKALNLKWRNVEESACKMGLYLSDSKSIQNADRQRQRKNQNKTLKS